MALGKIDHVDVTVDDLEKAEEYFTKKLGFKLLRRTEHAGKSIELASPAGDFFFDFHQMTDEIRDEYKAEQEASRRPIYFNHIAFKVDDINKEFEELKSKGVPVRPDDAPEFNPTTDRTLANVLDADGREWIQLTD